jgi:arylamine N-acetyltransferase
MLSELVAFLNSSATGAVLQIVLVRFDNGDLYLADTGFGGQGLLEPSW